jgi:hypothetical protein
MSRPALPLVLVLAAVACKGDGKAATDPKGAESNVRVAGVYPDKFKCDSIATPGALAQILGGTVKQLDTPIAPPKGIARPCNYQVDATGEVWTFDFDCRDDYKQRADALFEQYRQTSADNVAAFKAASDAGIKWDKDAGPPPRAPEGAVEVAVGAKGLDHHGQGLLFVDDDAPCYVRVVGPDAARRLELAKLIAKNLTFANAPMTPRPIP